jgi:glycosyltransferase involved in cell wall biosynthesis
MKVSVLMPTYNHAPFIAKAIDSFLAQVCDFDIELIIGDDASTDDTLQIAKKYADRYPDKIILIAKQTNEGLLKNYKSIISLAKGAYFAILESDDYWTDNSKLQQQIDFLDTHPTYGLSYTRWERLRDDGLTLRQDDSDVLEKYSDILYERFLLRNIIKSPTVCFRRKFYEQYCNIDDYIRLGFNTFDFPVWLSLIRHSNLHYINTPTAVYRSLSTSISNNTDLSKRLKFEYGVEKIRRYLIKLYGSGSLTMFQVANRETIIISRHAFRCKKPLTSLSLLFGGFFSNVIKNILNSSH